MRAEQRIEQQATEDRPEKSCESTEKAFKGECELQESLVSKDQIWVFCLLAYIEEQLFTYRH